MSPLENGLVSRDKDGFLRDERGLKSMPHLTAFIASLVGIVFSLAGVIGFFLKYPEAISMSSFGAGLVGAGQILEGWQTHVESRNQIQVGK